MMVDALTYLFNLLAERQKNSYKSTFEGLQNQHKKHQRQRQRQRYQHIHSNRQPRATTDYEQYQQQQQQIDDLQLEIHECTYKSKTLRLELVPPLISVSALLVVTIVVAKEAIHVLALHFVGEFDNGTDVGVADDYLNTTSNITTFKDDLDGDDRHHRCLPYDEASKIVISESAGSKTDPNIHLMMLFSVLNFALDGLNVFCFAKADHAAGYATTDHHSSHATTTTTIEFMSHTNPSRRQRREKTERNYPPSGNSPLAQDEKEPGSMGVSEVSTATTSTIDLLSQDIEGSANTNGIAQTNTTDPIPLDMQPQNQARNHAEALPSPTDNNFAASQNLNKAHLHQQHERHPQPHPNTPNRKPLIPFEIEDPINETNNENDDTKEGDANLNMCSAYTVCEAHLLVWLLFAKRTSLLLVTSFRCLREYAYILVGCLSFAIVARFC